MLVWYRLGSGSVGENDRYEGGGESLNGASEAAVKTSEAAESEKASESKSLDDDDGLSDVTEV